VAYYLSTRFLVLLLFFFISCFIFFFFFFSSRRRHTRSTRDWSSDVCSSDLCSEGAAGAGSDVCGGGLPRGWSEAGGGAERRPVEEPVRRGSADCGQGHFPEPRQIHGDWRGRAGISWDRPLAQRALGAGGDARIGRASG